MNRSPKHHPELDLEVAEKFYRYVRAPEPKRGNGDCTHQDAEGGWYSVQEYSSDQEAAWSILEECNNRSWTLHYSNMRDGRRGHYVTIGYFKNLVDSFYTHVNTSGESFAHALCLAVIQCEEEP